MELDKKNLDKNNKIEQIKSLLQQGNIEELSKLNKTKEFELDSEKRSFEELQEIDRIKSRILKYIVFKKRTESEIRNKFKNNFDNDLFEEVIDNLKELGYIDDTNYIKRAINEFISLKNMSMKEIKYKLLAKGIKNNIIEDYFSANYDELYEFEKRSAVNIFNKKITNMQEQDIMLYLRKKGYTEESIKNAKHLYIGDN